MSAPAAAGGAGTEPVVLEYLLLGLRLGRHVPGFVDSWAGDPALPARVEAEPPADPAALARRAARLRREAADSGLAAERRDFLTAQLAALECGARRLAGEQVPFVEEIETYFQVRIGMGDTDRYAAAHDALAGLLPGAGPLRARLEEFRARNAVPPDALHRAVRAVSDALRVLVRDRYGLPPGEEVTYEVVRDRPWNAFNRYLGRYRSVVSLNEPAGADLGALPLIAAHECYPGHHTERSLKEAELVADGQHEHAIALVNTPQSLMAEGIAEHALAAVMPAGWGAWTAEILAAEGVRMDGERVEQVMRHVRTLLPARQDAALLLHDRGAGTDAAVAHLRRWLLLGEERARRMTAFLTDPLWRAHTTTYIEGARLVAAWTALGDPRRRFRRLLAEPLLPARLGKDIVNTAPAH